MLNIICGRTDCKHNKENMQKLNICHLQVVRVSQRGFCQSRVKRDVQQIINKQVE